MTSPRGRRRNIYPMDTNDPNLRWCKDCEYPYMPAGGCKVHEGRCLTCCTMERADCLVRLPTGDLLAAREEYKQSARGRREATAEERAQVQRDIDALYGPQEDRNG